MRDEQPIFFETSARFRAWLKKHHASRSEQWVGFYRKQSGKRSISWPESVDQALCFGWIDGIRKTIDADSYKIRFTPRRAGSNWSALNTRRVTMLIRQGLVESAGLAAFRNRTSSKTRQHSYENRRSAHLGAAAERRFRSDSRAWSWFQNQPPGYRQTAIWCVVSAKRPETREKRLYALIIDSHSGRKIKPLHSVRGAKD